MASGQSGCDQHTSVGGDAAVVPTESGSFNRSQSASISSTDSGDSSVKWGKPSAKGHEQLVAWSATVKQAWDGINHSWTKDQLKPGAKKSPREIAYMSFGQEPWNEARKLELVKAFWRDFAARVRDPMDKLAAIKAAFGRVPVKSWLRKDLIAYIKPLDASNAAWQRWKTQPRELTKPWRERIDVPWDVDAKLREEEMLTALSVADREWRKVDGRGDLTWDEFQSQLYTAVAAARSPMVTTVASTWINEFNSLAGPSGLSFQPVTGTSPAKSGLFRSFDVHIDGSQLALDDETTGHTWTDETSFSYPEDTPPITAPWRPGQTLQIKVYGERLSLRGGLRPTYINQTFTGPIAIWRLAQAGTISMGEHSLTLKVTHCPGPPPPVAEIQTALPFLK